MSPEKDMMDLTGPVGNILDDLNSSPLSTTRRRSSQMMDFTKCVGSILAQIEREKEAAAHSIQDFDESLVSVDSMNSMTSMESSEFNESADQVNWMKKEKHFVLFFNFFF